MIQTNQGAPAPRRRVGAPRNWRAQFLNRLAETSNVSQAAADAQISLSWVYQTRREDRQFNRAWQSALCEGYDNLEMALLHRLLTGEAKDGDGRKYDNATAFRLLMVHKESSARQRAQRENESEEEILKQIRAKLAAMRTRQREATALLGTGKPVQADDSEAPVDAR
jgi:transcriptional antiterminator Rof (Rho-off)